MLESIKTGGILFIICLVASLGLGVVNDMTFDIIESRKFDTTAYETFFPQATFKNIEGVIPEGTEEGVTHIFEVSDADTVIGKVFSVNVIGYGGPMTMAVGVDTGGLVKGYVITADSETKGLGGKAKDESFIEQFINKPGDFEVVKSPADDNDIEALTGATITTVAVVKAVNEAIAMFKTTN